MLKEIIHYYSDTEPTVEEIEDLKLKGVSENKVCFVDYYCEYQEKIITLIINGDELKIR